MHVYRGWKSTKLHLALITMALLTIVYAGAGFPASAFGEYAMALVGAAGVFSTSATADRFAAPKTPTPAQEITP